MKNLNKFIVIQLIFVFCLLPIFAEGGVFKVDIPEDEKNITFSDNSPFALSLATDIPIGTLGIGSYVTSKVLKHSLTFTDYDSSVIYNKDDVNAFDRWAMNPYSKTFDTFGDIALVTSVATPVALYTVEALFGNLELRDGITLATMYVETALLANGIKDILKVCARRIRPYMYFENPDSASLENHDFQFSWPSGHTLNAFMGATFLTYTFCSYYPNSHWKIPVIAVSYALATGTGALRMLSGNHFFTDVLTGAALGSAFGFAVPFFHHLAAKNNAMPQARLGKTSEFKIISMTPMSLQMEIRL